MFEPLTYLNSLWPHHTVSDLIILNIHVQSCGIINDDTDKLERHNIDYKRLLF